MGSEMCIRDRLNSRNGEHFCLKLFARSVLNSRQVEHFCLKLFAYVRKCSSLNLIRLPRFTGTNPNRLEKYKKQINDEYLAMVKTSKKSLTADEAYSILCEKYWPKVFAEFHWRTSDDADFVRVPHSGRGAFNYATTEVRLEPFMHCKKCYIDNCNVTILNLSLIHI